MFGQNAANPYTGSLGTLSRCLSAIVSCKKKYGETCRSESVGEGTRELENHPYLFLLRQLLLMAWLQHAKMLQSCLSLRRYVLQEDDLYGIAREHTKCICIAEGALGPVRLHRQCTLQVTEQSSTFTSY